ncbi:hypothetical protein RRG08_063660 [Elysia crispata]|uniref:Uncharacterized protein n=1 Tax=Elysia crispata TaxID=231223 RepID=A0AAE1DM59_9GAST|nr:hypothetical protein RRG08_063660 [Elysia crispata]
MRVEEGGISSLKVRRETEVDTGRWAVTSTFVAVPQREEQDGSGLNTTVFALMIVAVVAVVVAAVVIGILCWRYEPNQTFPCNSNQQKVVFRLIDRDACDGKMEALAGRSIDDELLADAREKGRQSAADAHGGGATALLLLLTVPASHMSAKVWRVTKKCRLIYVFRAVGFVLTFLARLAFFFSAARRSLRSPLSVVFTGSAERAESVSLKSIKE